MREEKFKVIQYIRELIVAIDKQLDNFPRKDIELKNRVAKNSYDILEIAYEANVTMDMQLKKELVCKIICKTKVIDFLINLSHDKEIITEKKYYKISQRLDDIAKYATGWLKSIV